MIKPPYGPRLVQLLQLLFVRFTFRVAQSKNPPELRVCFVFLCVSQVLPVRRIVFLRTTRGFVSSQKTDSLTNDEGYASVAELAELTAPGCCWTWCRVCVCWLKGREGKGGIARELKVKVHEEWERERGRCRFARVDRNKGKEESREREHRERKEQSQQEFPQG